MNRGRERFEQKVDRSAGPNACHLFTGYRHHGYGRACVDGRKEWAHRIAWLLAGREIPAGMEVAHTCDVRNCVNIEHLWLATHGANMDDMFAKRRHKHGENASKLTTEQVRAIRARRIAGEPGRVIAAEFGISEAQVSRVANGRQWRHVEAA